MKRIFALLLALVMCVSLFAGCRGNQEENQPTLAPTEPPVEEVTEPAVDTNLEKAQEYLRVFYKDAPEKTAMDYTRIGTVRIANIPYEIVWTVDVAEDIIKVVKNDDGSVTIDLNEEYIANSTKPTPYVLTATLTGTDGRQVTLTWNCIMPSAIDEEALAIVDAAYALKKGESLEGTQTLTGKIISIDQLYDTNYKNITVTIEVPGREDKPIKCYRLKGEGADLLCVGDTITVTGVIKNYNGIIEFDAGCILEAVISGGGTVPVAPTDPAEIVKQAFALKKGKSLPYEVTLTGKVTKIEDPYDSNYGNLSCWIRVEGKSILCYRLGDGDAKASRVNVNDVITVKGIITNYEGTIEFNYPDLMAEEHHAAPKAPSTPEGIVDAAYALGDGETTKWEASLTGTVISIKEKYSSQYGNATVIIEVEGREGKPITCYHMGGNASSLKKLGIGDIITVKGFLTNYKGTIEFAQGCKMTKRVAAPKVEAPEDVNEIIAAAQALEDNKSLPYECTLQGTIVKINTPYDSGYKNITLTMQVEGTNGYELYCYRIKGDSASKLKVSDVIAVTGYITKYKGNPQFGAGSTVELISEGTGELPPVPGDGYTVDFSKLDKTEQYAETTVDLGNGYSLHIIDSQINTSLRLYQNNAYTDDNGEDQPARDGIATFTLPEALTTLQIAVDATSKDGANLLVYGSENGTDWTLIETLATNPGSEHAITLAEGTAYKYLKLDTENKQIRISSITFNGAIEDEPVVPAVGTGTALTTAPAAGDIIVITNGTNAMTAEASGSKLAAETFTLVDGKLNVTATMALLTVAIDDNGYYTFSTADGKYLTSAATGNGLSLADTATEYSLWTIEPAASGTFYIKNVNAAYNDVKNQALEYYSGFTTYGIKETAIYQMGIYKVEAGVSGDPIPNSELTIAEAVALGSAKEHNTYTDGKYYVSGTITEIVKAEYGNMIIADAEGNSILVYGSYDETGAVPYGSLTNKPAVGDTVKVYGIIGQYNGTAQIKNGWLIGVKEEIPEDQEVTIAEALAIAKENGSSYSVGKYIVTGEIISIANEEYGNLTIKDANGDELYIYGLYNEDGSVRYDKMDPKPAVGDTITVTGILGCYKDAPQMKNGWVTALNPGEGGETPDPEPVEQMTVAEILAAGETGKMFYVEGTVSNLSNTKYGNMDLVDETGTIYIYGLYNEDGTVRYDSMDVKPVEGDTIKIYGTLSYYNSQPQIASAWLIEHTPAETEPENDLEAAKEALIAKYTSADFVISDSETTMLGTGFIYNGVEYSILWEIVEDTNSVASIPDGGVWLTPGAEESTVKLHFGLEVFDQEDGIADITGEFTLTVPAKKTEETPAVPTTAQEIIDAAYALEAGTSLDGEYTLTGTILSIDTAYSEQYKNITVTIDVDDADKNIQCFRLKGDGADTLAVGNKIEVTGNITNYNGKIQFNAGATFTLISGGTTEPDPEPDPEPTTEGKTVVFDDLDATVQFEETTVDLGDGYSLHIIDCHITGDALRIYHTDGQYDGIATFTSPEVIKTVKLNVGNKDANMLVYGSENGTDWTLVETLAVTSAYADHEITMPEGTEYKYLKLDTSAQLRVKNITFNGTATEDGGETETPEVPVLDTPQEVIDAAYALEKGASLEGTYTLTGTILSIDTAYSEQYGNITVTIDVDDADKDILCYRLKGDGADTLAVGNKITVTGSIKNYNGTVEFDAGCTFTLATAGEGGGDDTTSEAQKIIDAAYALEENTALEGTHTLTGTITQIRTPYDASYKNISVVIDVEGTDKTILCYRLKGDGADVLKVGDKIEVTGSIKNYNGTVEFDAGCTFILVSAGTEQETEKPTTPQGIIDAAYALEKDTSLTGTYTLTGTIVSIDTAYSEQYGNITVTIDVDDADKNIKCYRLKGDGADALKVGDKIEVTGSIINYNGTVEFNAGCTFTMVQAAATVEAVVEEAPAAVIPEEPAVEEIA